MRFGSKFLQIFEGIWRMPSLGRLVESFPQISSLPSGSAERWLRITATTLSPALAICHYRPRFPWHGEEYPPALRWYRAPLSPQGLLKDVWNTWSIRGYGAVW